jgi:hypothetical protein
MLVSRRLAGEGDEEAGGCEGGQEGSEGPERESFSGRDSRHICLDFQGSRPRFAARFARWWSGVDDCWSPKVVVARGNCRKANQPTTNLNYIIMSAKAVAGATINEELSALIDSKFRIYKEGSIVNGTILDIRPQVVIVDIGYKSEGVIATAEV